MGWFGGSDEGRAVGVVAVAGDRGDLLKPGARVVVGSGSQGGQPGGVGGDGVVGQGLDACGDELVDLAQGLGRFVSTSTATRSPPSPT